MSQHLGGLDAYLLLQRLRREHLRFRAPAQHPQFDLVEIDRDKYEIMNFFFAELRILSSTSLEKTFVQGDQFPASFPCQP